MSDKDNHVEIEAEEYVTQLNDFIKQTNEFSTNNGHVDVVKRFVRDCDTLKTDLYDKKVPSLEDLCDYGDRFASLEIQFHNLKQAHKTNDE